LEAHWIHKDQGKKSMTICGPSLGNLKPKVLVFSIQISHLGDLFLEQCIMELNNLELTLRFLVQVFAWMGCQPYGCFFWCLLFLTQLWILHNHTSIHQGCDVVHPNDVRANNMLHVGWKCERWYAWTSLIGLEKADYKQIKYLHIVLHNNIIQVLILDNTWINWTYQSSNAYEVKRH